MTRAAVLLMCLLAAAACGKRGDLVPPPGKQPPAPIWEKQGPTPPVTPNPQAPTDTPGN